MKNIYATNFSREITVGCLYFRQSEYYPLLKQDFINERPIKQAYSTQTSILIVSWQEMNLRFGLVSFYCKAWTTRKCAI